MQSSSEFVKLHKFSGSDSGLVEVTLDMPGAKNVINKEVLHGLQFTLEAVNNDQGANVLMVSSKVDRVFCAGADLKERKAMTPNEVQNSVNSLRSTFFFLEGLHIPTIAVVEGAALGGGMEMALSCDLRICVENALFSLPEAGLAIIPGAGGTQRLPRLVGKSVAKDIIYSGWRISLNRTQGPLAIRMAKRAIDGGLDRDLESGLSLEMDCYEELLDTEGSVGRAFLQRMQPYT